MGGTQDGWLSAPDRRDCIPESYETWSLAPGSTDRAQFPRSSGSQQTSARESPRRRGGASRTSDVGNDASHPAQQSDVAEAALQAQRRRPRNRRRGGRRKSSALEWDSPAPGAYFSEPDHSVVLGAPVDGRGEPACKRDGTAAFAHSGLQNPQEMGDFRSVTFGIYVTGPYAGQPCAGKWDTGSIRDVADYRTDLRVVDVAARLVDMFSLVCGSGFGMRVEVLRPVLCFVAECGGQSKFDGKQLLVEPRLGSFRKFKSNTGWTSNEDAVGRAMQALSHFSFHATSGELLLCDLQGGVEDNVVRLTGPTIMSLNDDYGHTDIGEKGMRAFFKRHECNDLCHDTWMLPPGIGRLKWCGK